MIRALHIKDLAIVDALSIEFSPGFNVITGETGAGKSILIRALNLLMGSKASPDFIRSGREAATVSGEFLVPKDHAAVDALTRLGIPFEAPDDDVTIMIRRQIAAKGRSLGWINDVSVTTQCIRDVGMTLLDVFGQHENQKLLVPSEHVRYIDLYATDRKIKEAVVRSSEACGQTISRMTELIGSMKAAHRNKDFLTFRVKEVRDFSPSMEDFKQLSDLCRKAESASQFKDGLDAAVALLEEEPSLSSRLRSTSKHLHKIHKAELADRAAELAQFVDELNFEINRELSQLDVNEEDLAGAQKRLFDYQDMLRKYSVKDIDALLGEFEKQERELTVLETGVHEISELLELLDEQVGAFTKACEKLTQVRKSASAQVKKRVEQELKELSMPGSGFSVDWTPIERAPLGLELETVASELQPRWNKLSRKLSHCSNEGAERCQFLLASNPGEPLLPLAKVASGGELSRVMLALKKSLAVDAETCVLVFDEIDAGISGRVADVVGRKMRELADQFQVLCISHLPQVAVYADTHFLVEKSGKKSRTESSIHRLSRDESAKEIARLLSGAEVSSTSLKNAKHLIQLAHSKQKSARSEAKPL